MNSELQRSFRDLTHEEVVDVDHVLMLAQYGWSGTFGWKKLLDSKRILIISEAGAGKTFECRRQKTEMWDQGEPAFYVELAELAAASSFDETLSNEEEARFQAWLTSQSDVATFFLDSIDELKLTSRSFEATLRKLSRSLHGQLARVRIVITTRPIAIDRQLIERHLTVPERAEIVASAEVFASIAMGDQNRTSEEKAKDAAPTWRTVALMPLSDEQIQQMAQTQGVMDADALLADIRARNAQEFARRPQDLVEICADWRENRSLRCHREQVFNNIRVKLKPRTDRSEPAQLSPAKALEGASRLALAMLATRRLTIQLSSEPDEPTRGGAAIDPLSILHDWTPQEQETLLQRALFGLASYRRVRFQHRSAIEFLAALRLETKLSQGMPTKEVKRLLLGETPQGIRVVRPSMRPVAAWLAGSQPGIYTEVRDREPDVLLNYGDPESLTLSQRVDTLTFYVRKYSQGGWRGMHVPRIQVHRFASPELGDLVLKLLSSGIENPEVRELLLELAGAGSMAVCADIAYAIAMDSALTIGERLSGINALIAFNDQRLPALTESMADENTSWPDRLVRGAILLLFPAHISAQQLCKILERVNDSRSTTGEISWHFPRYIMGEDIESDYLHELCDRLTVLVTRNLSWDRQSSHPSTQFPHLVPSLAAVCLKLIRCGVWSDEVLKSVVILLRLDRHHSLDGETLRDLRSQIASSESSLRERVFWLDDAFVQSVHPTDDAWRRLINSFEGAVQVVMERDGGWMHKVLSDPQRPLLERTMMLNAMMRGMWNGESSGKERINSLRSSVIDEPVLSAEIDTYLTPRPEDPEDARFRARMAARRRSDEERIAANRAAWIAFWREVAEYPLIAFGPEKQSQTVWDLWNVMQLTGRESRTSGWNRRFLEQNFGKETTDRMRDAMREVWRSDKPTLRSERPTQDRGTTMSSWYVGLAAITAEAEDRNWAKKLSAEEAELAARYAPLDLEGFPSWVEGLAQEHPAAIEKILVSELVHELDEIATAATFSMQLQNVSHAPKQITDLFIPRLRSWLKAWTGQLREGEDEAAMARKMERAFGLVLEHDATALEEFREIAIARLKFGEDGAFRQLWLTILMRIDPAAGVEAFEAILNTDGEKAKDTAVRAVSSMFGARHGGLQVDLKRKGFTPAVLLQLLRLAYRYVSPSDDLVHEGTYTPSTRDEAQHGRNAILSAVLDGKGPAAWAAKLAMVDDPLFAHFRDRISLIAREKAAEEVDESIMTEADAATLDQYGTTPPKTRDDMFATLKDRLNDLDDVLLQDDSPRALWASTTDERVIRQQIAKELRSAARHAYTVDQEAATADEKETDIRLRAVSSDQQATIELKIGESYSGRELRDTIKYQLVTKYMASENSRSGCLLVTVAKDGRTWLHPDTNEPLDADGLRTMLEAEAAQIVTEMGNCLRLSIKVLDLRPRLTTESKRTRH
ncbi:MAG: hypothetical protein AMXMBFR59_22660 [Rhodanobacteraceae bacterium]